MTPFGLADEKRQESKESNIPTALKFVSSGEEILKRTRKGIFSQEGKRKIVPESIIMK